jgi:hypothetical protein
MAVQDEKENHQNRHQDKNSPGDVIDKVKEGVYLSPKSGHVLWQPAHHQDDPVLFI